MKKYIITSLLLLFAVSSWNCEKDDICAETTPKTPKVIIDFYDIINQTELKNVTNLVIIEPSFNSGFSYNGVNTINIPLRTNQDTTTLQFILNGSDNDTTNDIIDELTFNYERNDVYISRACGYKTLFQLNTPNGITTSSNNWIQNIEIIQANINNENETHVKIYF